MKNFCIAIVFFTSLFTFAQEKTYSHCNCSEILTSDSYKVVSNGVDVETGQIKDGKRHGLWESKSKKGIGLRIANYVDGELHGAYKLFHDNGIKKLIAVFKNGKPSGEWTYYNTKGKTIKHGQFIEGKPVGIWKVYDKKGKKVYAEYNFDTQTEIIASDGRRYLKKGGINKDEQSGEWVILFSPNRSIEVDTKPLGGYDLASDYFVNYFNIPTILMNTYAHFEFMAKMRLKNGGLESMEIIDNEDSRFDETSHSLYFMVETNPPNKLSRVKYSEATIQFLKDQVMEYVLIASPWVSLKDTEEIDVQIPIVINEVKKW